MSEITETSRPWLAELVSRYGESRVSPGPAAPSDGSYERGYYVWFPDDLNVKLRVDWYPECWVIQAMDHGRRAYARLDCPAVPDDSLIRTVLVTAGLLDDANADPDPEDPWTVVAAHEQRWQQLKDYLKANHDEAVNDWRQWDGMQPETARAARSETFGQVQAYMEEIKGER